MSNPLNSIFFAIGMPGTGELILILAIVLVLFGGAKIPEISKNIGKGFRELKKAISGGSDDDRPEKPGASSKP